jgi:hypothetical protein
METSSYEKEFPRSGGRLMGPCVHTPKVYGSSLIEPCYSLSEHFATRSLILEQR